MLRIYNKSLVAFDRDTISPLIPLFLLEERERINKEPYLPLTPSFPLKERRENQMGNF
jgi:hypothetical protein